jgi:hypothetical protein
MTADLPTTRRATLLAAADWVEEIYGSEVVAEGLRDRAGDYPAAEEHIDPVPHDPDLPRDLGAVERGACGAVIPPLGDICQMTPGHRDHVRTGTLFVRLTQKQDEADQLQGEVDRLRELLGEALNGWRAEVGAVFACRDQGCPDCKTPDHIASARIAEIKREVGLT